MYYYIEVSIDDTDEATAIAVADQAMLFLAKKNLTAAVKVSPAVTDPCTGVEKLGHWTYGGTNHKLMLELNAKGETDGSPVH